MGISEQSEIRALAREFALGEIRPHVERWDAERALPAEIFQKLAELGFLGMRVPEAFGGLEFDAATYLGALEALSWGDASVGLAVAIHNGPVTRAIVKWGTEAQKERWLPAMAAGEALGAFALSETEAGSDPSAIGTRARRADGGWSLEGRKRWVTNGDRAGVLLVFARTREEGSGREGISAFLVPRDVPGLEVGERERTLGLSASETVEISLNEARVGEDALLSEEGRGYALAMDALDLGRAGVAAQALGIAQAAFEHALRYSGEREQFGSPLSSLGAVQEKLAGMAIRIAQARALLHEVAIGLEEAETEGSPGGGGLPLRASSAMVKVAASEAAMWCADEAVQIFGGYGYMRDYPVERLMRDAKGTEIYEGSNEVLRMLVARAAVREASTGT
jgi:alkylation response protein AidB-like acyl-CoA dehydrogenase